MSDSEADLVKTLDAALDAVLTARTQVGGVASVPVPNDALDAALAGDRGEYRRALRAHRRLHQRLRALVDADHHRLLLDLADSATAMASASSEVGFRLGFALGRAGGGS